MADPFSKDERSRIMRQVRGKDTSPEMVVRRMVHAMGHRYRLHDRSLPGSPDLVFPRLGKVVQVRGCFWHMHDCGRCRIPQTRRGYWTRKLEGNRRRDAAADRRLRRMGWSLMIVWECQTTPTRRDRLSRRLARFLAP